MKLIRILAIIFAAATASSGITAQEMMYAVGPFNGWDAKTPLEFEQDGDIFTITIDFSSSREFKMSTVSGKGSQGNGWTEFDTGALKPVSDASVGEWVSIHKNSSGNIIAPDSKTLTVQVNLTTMRMRFVRSAAPEYSGTLPVLHINTENGSPITSKDTYLQGSYYLNPLGAEGIEAIGSPEAPLALQIRGRGNYTWTGFNKKPYRLKLAEKEPLLGMTKSKHFVLLAHADDRVGFMRNTLGFAASRCLGLPWTPSQQPVEVVLNGDYIGLYFLTENIRVDKNRVNVTEQEDFSTQDVDGGWLVEIDNYDTDPHITVFEGSYPIWFTYKSPEILSSEQEGYLQEQMQGIQNAIDARDYAQFSTLVDVDILARYYLVQEILNDYESFHGSCYLNRQRGSGERWCFGPVWDFGSALFNDNDNRFIWDSGYHQVWIGAVCAAFPQFMNLVKTIWTEFLEADGPETIQNEGRALAGRIASAASADYRRWPDYGNADELSCADVAFRRMQSKIDWLKKQWGDAGSIDCTLPSGTLKVYTVSGTLYIVAPHACRTEIVSLDGRVRRIDLQQGINTITTLPRGFYIVGGVKAVI